MCDRNNSHTQREIYNNAHRKLKAIENLYVSVKTVAHYKLRTVTVFINTM